MAVVGGGASGTLTALNLLRSGGDQVDVTIFEASGRIGYGVAYSTTDGRHLLNVRADNMSGFPDISTDLLDWAHSTGRPLTSTDFLPRRDYALYLRDRLAAISEQVPDRLHVVGARVTDLEPVESGFRVHAEAGGVPEIVDGFDSVVLAYGNPAPRPLAVGGVELPDAPWHLADPWDVARIAALPKEATVVLVGSGLTAIDTAITLLDDEPDRRVLMVSRHGLLPEPHIEEASTAWVTTVPDGPLTADGLARLFVEQVEAAAAHGVDWRAVVDGLRGSLQSIWRRLDADERRAFLARHARHWEVRRHRMAPGVAALIARYAAEGRLEIHAGGLASVEPSGDGVVVGLADRTVTADAVVNCTGPLADITGTDNPLLAALQRRGLITADPLRLGVDSTPEGACRAADGTLVPGLFVVGPPRKGVLYETTAIPEIRVQAADVAGRLLTAPRP